MSKFTRKFFGWFFKPQMPITLPPPAVKPDPDPVPVAATVDPRLGVDTSRGYEQTIAYVDLMLGTANAQRRTPEQDAAQQAAIDAEAGRSYEGVLTAKYLNDQEARFIHHNANAFQLQKQKKLWTEVGLVSGTQREINDAINKGSLHLNGFTGDFYEGVGTHVRQAVEAKWREHGGWEG